MGSSWILFLVIDAFLFIGLPIIYMVFGDKDEKEGGFCGIIGVIAIGLVIGIAMLIGWLRS